MERIDYGHYFSSDEIFLLEGDIALSYRDFYKELEKIKLPNSQRVAISQSGIPFLLSYFATILSGKEAILLDPNSPQDYQEELLEQFEDWQRIDEATETFKLQDCDPNQTAAFIFTSGSTGKPKAIEVSHKNLYKSALGTNEFYQINRKSHWAATLPLFHVGGLLIIYRTLLAQARTRLINAKNINSEILKDRSITHLSLVSLQLQRILEDKQALQRAKDLEGIILGGAKTPDDILKESISHGLKLSNSYGQSESCAQAMATEICSDLEILKSVGKPLPYREIEIIDSKIVIRGDIVAKGIYKTLEFYSEIRTQDMASIDERGNYNILARADDVFISGGENINPHEINQLLCDKELFPSIKNAFTFKVADKKYGHKCCALIQSASLIDLCTIRNQLMDKLPSYKHPKLTLVLNSFESFISGIKIKRSDVEAFAEKYSFLNARGLSSQLFGNPEKPLLIFFHGFMGKKEDFYFMAEELREHFLMAFIDLPHFGESQDHDFKDWSDFSDYLALHFNKLDKAINILGYSMGGRVAFDLSLKLEKTKKLILESSGLGLPERTAREKDEKQRRWEQDQRLLNDIKDQEDLNRFIEKWYAMPLFKGIKDYADYPLIADKKFEDIQSFQKGLCFFSLAKQLDYRPRLRQSPSDFAQEIHYIFGHLDRKYTAFALELNEMGIQIHGEEAASHNVHCYNKNKYLALVKECLLK